MKNPSFANVHTSEKGQDLHQNETKHLQRLGRARPGASYEQLPATSNAAEWIRMDPNGAVPGEETSAKLM